MNYILIIFNRSLRLIDDNAHCRYILTGIGLSVSPLSNNNLFCPLAQNPFKSFLERGLFSDVSVLESWLQSFSTINEKTMIVLLLDVRHSLSLSLAISYLFAPYL